VSATYPEPLGGAELREKLRLEQEAGRRAALLVNSDEYRRVIEEYEELVTATWANSQFADAEGREAAYHQIRALSEIDARLRDRVMTGKLAAETLDSMEESQRSDEFSS
jgi:hypothetical protein